jgi:hypothetical protein
MAEFLIPSGSKRISTLNQISGIPLASSSAMPIVLGNGSPVTNGSTFQISHTDFLNSTVFNRQNTFNNIQIIQRDNTDLITFLTADGIAIRDGGSEYGFRVDVDTDSENIRFRQFPGLTPFLEIGSDAGDVSIPRNTSIDGNLIVSGGITTEILNVNVISSSIVYSSGSNIFGNTISNTHQFTGSLRVSGSANIIGGLTQTVGTVSFGGAATFNNSITTFNQGINVLNQSSSFFAGVNIGTSPQTRNLTHFGNYIHTGDVIQTGSISVNGNVIASSFTGSLNYTNLNNIPNGIVSSSTQINQYNIFATTGSNGFVGNQNINGDVVVTGSLIVSGSNTFTNIGRAEFTGSINVNGGVNVTQSITASIMSGSFVGNGSSLSGVTAADVDFVNVLNKPTLVSGSSQIDLTGATNYVSGIKTRLNAETVVSSSQQIKTLLPTGTVSGSSQVSFDGIVDKPTLFSSSIQVDADTITNFDANVLAYNNSLGVVSGSSQISFNGIVDKPTLVSGSTQVISLLPNGTVSGSSQVSFNGIVDKPTLVSSSQQILDYGILATTGSNTFIGNQIITGSLTVSGSNTFTNIGKTELTGSVEVEGDVGVYGNITAVQKTIEVLGFPTNQPAFYSEGDIILSGSLNIHVEELGQSFDVAEQFQQAFSSISFTQEELEIISSSYATTGSNIFVGSQFITGSLSVSGSTIQIGNNTLDGNTVLSGSILVSGSQLFRGNQTLSGSFLISGSTSQFGNNTLIGDNTITGSNSLLGNNDIVGTNNILGDTLMSGSLVISSSADFNGDVNINGCFFVSGSKQFNRGQFYHTETLSGSANTAFPFQFNTTDTTVTNGTVYVDNDSRIYVVHSGVYNIQFSAQLRATTNDPIEFSIWFAMTGSNIMNSNSDFSIAKTGGGGNMVAALNYLMPIESGSYIELYYSKTRTDGEIQAKGVQTSPTRPATPSVILTVTQTA